MTHVEKLQRVPLWVWTVLFAALLIVPGLGSYGFWDPWELGIADRARAVAQSGSPLDTTAGGRFAAEPPLDLFLTATGMKVFGERELGGRILNGLFAVGTLLAVYWAGLGLFRRRAALLSALALGTMPLFLFQSRQLASDMPLMAGLALSLGGLGRFAWPASGQRSWRDLLLGVLGLLIGLGAGGALLGVALPCLSLAGVLIVGWGIAPRGPEAGSAHLTSDGVGRDVPAEKTFGAGLRASGVRGLTPIILLVVLGLGVLVAALTTANVAGQYSLLLGGVPRGGTPPQMFEYLVKQLGFGLFPWSALAVFALARALIRLSDGEGGRLAFVQSYLLLFAAFGFALSTVFVLMTGDARFPVLAPIALAVGAFLDEALEGERSEPVLGLLVATGTLVVARDFFLTPEELVSVHLPGQKVKWPPTIAVGYAFMAVGVVVALGIYTGLATRGRALGRVAPRDLGDRARPWQRRLEALVVEVGRWGVQAAVVGAVLFAGFLSHGLLPMLSKHFSFKPVFESYARYAKEGEEIGRYKVEGHGSAFYSARTMVDIASQDQLVAFLRRPARTFCLVSADDLPSLDAAFKTAKVDYYVIDASSSRFLLLSNRVNPGEEDRNPLTKDVWMAPRPPEKVTAPGSTAVTYEWHGQAPPWKWRIPASTVFGGAIELVGADFPESVRRPGKIPLTLYFRVNARPPSGYKIFVHFDAPGDPRLIGDHAPLNGSFPTTNWLPGEYIRDFYEVDVPLMTTPAGTYTVLVGFWPGGEGKRIPITSGHNDTSDRTKLGTIEIR